MNALFLHTDGGRDDEQCLPETLLKSWDGGVEVEEGGGTGVERKQDRETEKAQEQRRRQR